MAAQSAPVASFKILFAAFSILLFAQAGYVGPSQAQQERRDPTESRVIVRSVAFEGEPFFSTDALRLRVRTGSNRRLLGIPGLTWWRWVYGVGASGRLGRRLSRALTASGEPPALLDSSVVAADLERLELFYHQEGFRQAAIRVVVDTLSRADHARVTFRIDAGPPTFMRSLRFEGLEDLSPAQQLELAEGTRLRVARIDRDAPLEIVLRNQRYSEPLLLEERRRLLTFLRDQGFASVSRDSIRAVVFPQPSDSFDVAFFIRTGPVYRFGDVHFDVVGPESGQGEWSDTLWQSASNVVTARVEDEPRLASGLLLRSLRFRPGDRYDQSLVTATKRRLEATGVFSFTDVVPRPPQSLGPREAEALPHRIDLRTRQRHQIRLETFMLQRSGVLTGSDNELGTGLSLAYENANLLGGGEAFEVRTTGSIATDTETRLFTSAQAEVATSLSYPYLVRPFRSLDRMLGLYDGRTRLSFSLLTARREELGLVIRGRGAARFRLEMQHTSTITSMVDLLDLTLSNPDTLDQFTSKFLDKILGPEDSVLVQDPVQRAQILEDYTQPQVNSALRYTIRSARVNPFRLDRGYSYEAAFEVGGNLPYLLDRVVFTPSETEGSLPGLPFFRGDRRDSRLVYRQYVRFIGDARRYHRPGRRSVLATKFIIGIAHPIGRSNVIPFDRRFYSGGATSVRGWGLRELGPGSAVLGVDSGARGPEVTNIRGGDIKLEAGVELRHTVLRRLLAADWIGAAFADAGNYWFGPRNPGDAEGRFRFDRFYRELGVGSGVGLRIAWEYLIIRLDMAYRVLDPVRRGRILPDRFADPAFHFGIGHAF